MYQIKLPSDSPTTGGVTWTPTKVLRDLVLNLPFWKAGSDISRVNGCLEIEDALDAANGVLEITKEAWGFLKEAMQLTAMNPIGDPVVNRLYMKTYKSILTAQDQQLPA